MIKVLVLFTCFNRKKITMTAINKLLEEKSSKIDLQIIAVDDCSTDGTYEMLQKQKKNIIVLRTKGNYYYSKSMRYGMKYIKQNKLKFDYLLMINDDVMFYQGFINKLITYQQSHQNSIIVGCTEDDNGDLSYGGIKYLPNSIMFNRIGPNNMQECDTFNGNCNLIPYNCFINSKIMDRHYRHSIGDFDYGFDCRKNGMYKIIVFDQYIGKCNRNSLENTWFNKDLSKIKRIKLLNSIKSGNPSIKTFYYYNKNFNLKLAIKSVLWPYKEIFRKEK